MLRGIQNNLTQEYIVKSIESQAIFDNFEFLRLLFVRLRGEIAKKTLLTLDSRVI
jgi:hypothetical protein